MSKRMQLAYLIFSYRPNLYLGFKLVGQEDYFELDYIVDDVRRNGVNCSKTIVYAPTMEECSDIYFYFYEQLHEQLVVGDTRLVHTYFEMAGEETLKYIKEQFTSADSPIRVLIAEVDYEIDFNVDGVLRVVHWGGPKNAISYWKEVGYAGRAGEFCDCMWFYIPKILREVAYDWKFIAALRRMANLPTKNSNTITQSSQTKMTHTDEDCSEPAMLSDAMCALEVKEDPPCFRRYLVFNVLRSQGLKVSACIHVKDYQKCDRRNGYCKVYRCCAFCRERCECPEDDDSEEGEW